MDLALNVNFCRKLSLNQVVQSPDLDHERSNLLIVNLFYPSCSIQESLRIMILKLEGQLQTRSSNQVINMALDFEPRCSKSEHYLLRLPYGMELSFSS